MAKSYERQNKEKLYNKKTTKIKEKVLANGTSPSDHRLTHHFNSVARHIENPLHKFASYNTLFTLSGLTEEEVRNPKQYLQTKTIHDVVARSAGIGPEGTSKFTTQKKITQLKDTKVGSVHEDKLLHEEIEKHRENLKEFGPSAEILFRQHDIFFENVNILSTASPSDERNTMNFTKINFELHEPYGVTFVEKIRGAAFQCGYKDYQDAPFLLTIEWRGFDEKGRNISVPDTLIRRIPILISRVEFDVNEGGAVYQIIAVPYTDLATMDRFHQVRTAGEIKEDTLDKFGIELEKLMDEQMKSEIEKKTRQHPDKYKFIFDPALGKLSTKPSSERVSGRKHLRFGIRGQPVDMGEVPEAMIKPGMGIVKILEDAVKGTRFFKNLIANFWDTYFGKVVEEDTRANTNEYFNTEEGQKELTKILNNNQQVPWFKVISTVHTNLDLGIDSITKMYSKTVIFKVIPYNFHVLKLLMPGMSIGKTDWDKYVRKSYNYLYTGENIDIQKLHINYKTGFYQRNLIEVKTKDGFAQNIISAVTDFGKRWVGSQKEHPEPKFPLRSYPSLIKSDQQTKTGDSQELMVSEFFDYLVNPTADMIQVEMDILGDPGLLAQDMYITIDGQYASKNTYVGNDAWSEELGCFNLEYQMPIINLNYRLPADIDVEKGFMFSPNKPTVDDNISFSGAYQITKVESRIDNGQFIQTLTMTRLNNQQGIGRAPFSLSTGDSKVIYDKKKENIDKKKTEEESIIWGEGGA